MLTKEELQGLNDAAPYYLPNMSVDCVVLGFHEGQLKVLLVKVKDEEDWYLPGGFIKNEEPVDDAVVRVLEERTKLTNIFLKQFYLFGDPKRTKDHYDRYHVTDGPENFMASRFITVGYYALVDFTHTNPLPGTFSVDCAWWELQKIPKLILDHDDILKKALETLRIELIYQPIGYKLLPEEFTMPELQKLYETILGKTLDRRNFQRKILSYDILIKLDKTRKGGAHKSPNLYSFNLEKYELALRNGLQDAW